MVEEKRCADPSATEFLMTECSGPDGFDDVSVPSHRTQQAAHENTDHEGDATPDAQETKPSSPADA